MDLAALELDGAGDEGEEGVVFADAHIKAGLELRAALADDDRAGLGGLASVELDTAELGAGVATVFGRTLSFFVGHNVTRGGGLFWGGRFRRAK